jgi:hypothetical protein
MSSIALQIELLIRREVLVVFPLNFENLPVRDHLGQQLCDQDEVDRLLKERHLSKFKRNGLQIIPGCIKQERDFPAMKFIRQIKGSAVPESDIENGCIGPVALDPGEGLRDPVEGADNSKPCPRDRGHKEQVRK